MDDYRGILSEITRINRQTGLPDLSGPVATMMDGQHRSVQVAVLGQFKSGKSSLINTLLGEDLLPMGAIPVTAVITQVEYSANPFVRTQYADGRIVESALEQLPALVTEKGNPENYKQIQQVFVGHPGMAILQNICLVDTPGLSSINRHNSETTRHWLPFAGVALVTISAERPLSEEDMMLIKGSMQACPEVVVIVTKSDIPDASGLSEILDYVLETVLRSTGRRLTVLPFSSRINRKEYREKLVESVLGKLNTEYMSTIEEIIRFKTQSVLDESIQLTRMAFQVALKKEQDKIEVLSLIDETRVSHRHHQREIFASGSVLKGAVRPRLESILLPFSEAVSLRLENEFPELYAGFSGSLDRCSRQFEQWLQQCLNREIRSIDENIQTALDRIIEEATDYYQYAARKFRDRIADKLKEMFGVAMPDQYWQIDRIGVHGPDVTVYPAFDTPIDMLLFFLPMRWFRPLFFWHFFKQIPNETEKNLYRHISDLTESTFKAMEYMQRQAFEFMAREMDWIDSLLLTSETNYQELNSCLQQLEKLNDLVIMGCKGHSGLWGNDLGHVTDKVSENARCNVLIVRDDHKLFLDRNRRG